MAFSVQHNVHHMIFLAIQNASDQKTEMEKIKGKMAQEVSKIEERKAKIDDELKEVQVSFLIDLCSHYVIISQLLKIHIHTTPLYFFHICNPSCTYFCLSVYASLFLSLLSSSLW